MTPRKRPDRDVFAYGLTVAGLYAAAELGAALLLGRLFDWGRAELLLFLAFRPWLLLLLATAVAGRPLWSRASTYALALVLATAGELILLSMLGGGLPWREAAWGLLAGAALAAALDFAYAHGRAFFARRTRYWRAIMAAALGAALLSPFGLPAYEAIALRGEAPTSTADERPTLLLMTALPIIWGEKGAFDPESRPAAAYRALQRDFDVKPLDTISRDTLGRARLMLIAQPRALAPAELAALDAWVRSGGRALILTDPALLWPSQLPLGDMRRAPAIGLLSPLLSHWGVKVGRPHDAALLVRDVRTAGVERRLALAAPGTLRTEGPACQVVESFLARCGIGVGEALVLADADLLRDDLWVAPGEGGESRNRRRSDNVAVVLDLLDGLAGVERERAAVEWQALDADRTKAVILGLVPAVLALAAGLALLILPFRAKWRA